MSESIRSLLAESIDYAGMFPPAQMPLDVALRNYVRHIREPDAWLMGRFVCPAVRLSELGSRASVLQAAGPTRRAADRIEARIRATVAEQLGVDPEQLPDSIFDAVNQLGADSLDTVELVMELEEEFDLTAQDVENVQTLEQLLAVLRNQFPHRIAVVVAPLDRSKRLVEELRHDASNVVEFQKTHGEYVTIDSFELKLPNDVDTSVNQSIVDLLSSIRHQLDMAELRPINMMIEVRPSDHVEGILAILDAVETIRDDQFCMKIRTGGLPRDDMPTADQLAFFIDACRTSHVRWKATAGLHHPLSCFNSDDRVWHFGFLNVFAAAALASTKRISQEQIAEILTETSVARFAFTNASLSWNEWRLTVPEIEEGRRRSIGSFGSCSFDEPRHGLRKLMLIT